MQPFHKVLEKGTSNSVRFISKVKKVLSKGSSNIGFIPNNKITAIISALFAFNKRKPRHKDFQIFIAKEETYKKAYQKPFINN